MGKRTMGATGACSYCGKKPEHRRLIAGPGVAICAECIGQCNEILREEGSAHAHARHERAERGLCDLPSEVLPDGLRRRSSGIHVANQEIQEVVMILRQQDTTWARIVEAFGASRQSAWGRYSGEE